MRLFALSILVCFAQTALGQTDPAIELTKTLVEHSKTLVPTDRENAQEFLLNYFYPQGPQESDSSLRERVQQVEDFMSGLYSLHNSGTVKLREQIKLDDIQLMTKEEAAKHFGDKQVIMTIPFPPESRQYELLNWKAVKWHLTYCYVQGRLRIFSARKSIVYR